MVELTEIQQDVVACVAVHAGQLTRSGVAKLLAGSHSARLDVAEGDEWLGRYQSHSRKSLTHLVDTLLQQGLLAETWDGKIMLAERTSSQFPRP